MNWDDLKVLLALSRPNALQKLAAVVGPRLVGKRGYDSSSLRGGFDRAEGYTNLGFAADAAMAELARVQDSIEAANLWELDRIVDRAMQQLRCPPPDALVSKLSGGERRRLG